MGQPNEQNRETVYSHLIDQIEELSNQLCLAVKGDFNFTVQTQKAPNESIQKLSMLINFVIDTARRALLEVNDKNLKLTELDKLKSEFISNVSHELRTPLTLILGPLEGLLTHQDRFTPEVKDNLRRMHRNSIRLYTLVNDLLDFSKLEAGKFQIHEELLDLNDITAQIVDDAIDLAHERQITLTFSPCQGLELLWCDRKMVEKIILNLLSNALKFTKSDGIVHIQIEKKEQWVKLIVKDTGIGIPKEKLANLFERFYQVDSSSTRSHEGTGIGLTLIKQFATLLGGNIEAVSELGKGTQFTVELPIRTITNTQETVINEPQENLKALKFSLSKLALNQEISQKNTPINKDLPSILIVDDNQDMRTYISSILKGDYNIIEAENGQEALKAIYKNKPQVILSDIMMPIMDGIQLTQKIKADPEIQNIPIILISAKTGNDAVVCGLSVGAEDYLSKPFSPEELRARLKSALRTYQDFIQLKKLNLRLQEEIEERKKLEINNQTLHAELVTAARQAGMADLATSILHNIGNVLNTVNTSAVIIKEQIENSNLSKLSNVASLLKEHKFDLSTFLSNSPQGQNLPDYLIKLSDLWDTERSSLSNELQLLENGIQHIKEIITKQNLLTKSLGLIETFKIPDLIDDAISLNKSGQLKSNINFIRDYKYVDNIKIDRVKLLQIIVNLIKNGVEAVNEYSPQQKEIILRTKEKDKDHFMIQVTDNGVGISHENLQKIFSFGFTTKKDGHGFGLHSSAITAQELGAKISVESEGVGKGATFSLILPYQVIKKQDKADD